MHKCYMKVDLKSRKPARITRKGTFSQLHLLSKEVEGLGAELESIKETIELMKDPKFQRTLEELDRGEWITWEELQRRWKAAHGK